MDLFIDNSVLATFGQKFCKRPMCQTYDSLLPDPPLHSVYNLLRFLFIKRLVLVDQNFIIAFLMFLNDAVRRHIDNGV